MDINVLRDAIRANRKRLRITTHAQVEAAKDGLLLEDLRKVFFEGALIERSDEIPRVLLLGQAISACLPVHIVVEDSDLEGVIITAYVPDTSEWDSNWRRRKRRGDGR